MQPEEFLLPHEAWSWWERQALALAWAAGSVLDLGAVAGAGAGASEGKGAITSCAPSAGVSREG
jgi:hypothetical protein